MCEQAQATARGHVWTHNVEWQLGTALRTKCPLCPRVNTLCCLEVGLRGTVFIVFIGEGWQDWVLTHE